MIFTKPIEFKEALQSRKVKKLMPTAASSLELEGLEPAIRERAFFMARVNHAGLLGKTDSVIASMLEEGVDINSARAQLKLHLKGIGYDPDNPPKGLEPAKPGSLRDLSSDARLNLVLDTNLKMANGYGRFAKANDPDIVDAFPVWELVRDSARKEEREWHSRWIGAGGKLYGGGRMMARKDDPIWSNLGPFKLPYPPFDYNSGMGVDEIDRAEAEALGVVKPSTIVEPQSRGFNESVMTRLPKHLDADLKQAVLNGFLGSAELKADRIHLRVFPESWDTRGMKPLKEIPAQGGLPEEISTRAFIQTLESGKTVTSPVGDVMFNQKLERHWVHAGKVDADMAKRAKNLPAAMETVKDPLEVWERGDRLLYLGKFSREGKRGDAVMQVFTDKQGVVQTYIIRTKQFNSIDKGRSGKLRPLG